jgi:hypothetical protein
MRGSVRISAGTQAILTEIFRGVSQYLQPNAVSVSQWGHVFPSECTLARYSPIILQLYAIYICTCIVMLPKCWFFRFSWHSLYFAEISHIIIVTMPLWILYIVNIPVLFVRVKIAVEYNCWPRLLSVTKERMKRREIEKIKEDEKSLRFLLKIYQSTIGGTR